MKAYPKASAGLVNSQPNASQQERSIKAVGRMLVAGAPIGGLRPKPNSVRWNS